MKKRLKYRVWDKESNEWYQPTYEAYKGNLEFLTLTPSGDLMMTTLHNHIHESVFPDRFEVRWYLEEEGQPTVEVYSYLDLERGSKNVEKADCDRSTRNES